jgi:hypothetical protein
MGVRIFGWSACTWSTMRGIRAAASVQYTKEVEGVTIRGARIRK